MKEALNRIYNLECLEGMERFLRKYGPGCIDMILCDLPYGTTKNKWDSVIPLEPLWSLYKQLIKPNGAIVLTASQPFTSDLVVSNKSWFKYSLVWDKRMPVGHLNAKRMPLRQHEDILVFYNKPPVYNPIMKERGKPRKKGGDRSGNKGTYGDQGDKSEFNNVYYPTSIVQTSNANQKDKIHPTQKPVELFEYLVKTYTNESNVILDNCMGSGTTAVACINTNRQFIGFELDKEYHRIATERIAGVAETAR